MYNVKIEQFEGPLDLLLELINKEKMDITNISLAQIADQYLDYLENKEDINIVNLADFLTVAAKLILIKSKALLPLLDLSNEEEEEIFDLEKQLEEYRKFKLVAQEIEKIYNNDRQSFSRDNFIEIEPQFAPPEGIGGKELAEIYNNILGQIPVFEKLEEERIIKVISLRERIDNLKEMLSHKAEINFSELVKKGSNRVEIIVSFLAVLEMVKRRIVVVEQGEIFHDIKFKKII
ncbi:MAG: segregation/condensation protein A [Candidatus Moranbacteria bacterium]|jgi:segregation and condensation protein A|nr:segregation/condensation protein A [Candidatus Moranbacteria bacterium]